MIIRKPEPIPYSQVTPRSAYLNRRRFLAAAGAALAVPQAFAGTKIANLKKGPFSTSEKLTSLQDATTYNNFYEFGTSKDQPAKLAEKFVTTPWTVTVEGAVAKPRKFDVDQIMRLAPVEERIYRMRCVEGWSMVIPWAGFPLNAVLNAVEPSNKARYVAFQSYYEPRQMPQGRYAGIELPYVEGLRMDEAMHPLTLLTVGMYGELLPNQNGAPLRLVVPWKYGFKSIKSIVKIRVVEKEPPTTWSRMNPREYGFYSNVNPEVDHPRWSQARERRIGEFFKRPTLKFNGYGDQVASLYTGLDLKKNY